jgi:hypothetical protein
MPNFLGVDGAPSMIMNNSSGAVQISYIQPELIEKDQIDFSKDLIELGNEDAILDKDQSSFIEQSPF